MFSSDGHSGYATFGIGLVILVIVSIALSIAVEKRFRFSSAISVLEAEIRKNEPELERLRTSHRESSLRWLELEPERTAAAAALKTLVKEAASMERREASLASERAGLTASIPLVEEEFGRYRTKYITMIRESAIGESLGLLRTLSGNDYDRAFITRVTDAGLEIRHAHGTARIAAADLPAEWSDRFQWGGETSMDRVAADGIVRPEVERPATTAAVAEKPVPRLGAAGRVPREADALRDKLIAWKARVSRLQQEINWAQSSAGGSQASVPGGLETWPARLERLTRELETAQAELAAVQAALELALQHDGLPNSPRASGR